MKTEIEEELKQRNKELLILNTIISFINQFLNVGELLENALEKVLEIMTKPTEGEIIEENATLGQAIHLLVMGQHQSLMVMNQDEIIGIVRLTDVFAAIFHTMKECKL